MNAEYLRELEDCVMYIVEMSLFGTLALGLIVCILVGLFLFVKTAIKGEW